MRRGAQSNPPNRFEKLRYDFADAEPAPDDEPADPRVQYLRDPSRTIVATNSSPDVGFEASVNPYRGCAHACTYCLAPGTRVLRADFLSTPIAELRPGDAVLGFDEHGTASQPRKLRVAVVRAVWWSTQPTLRIVTDTAEIVTSPEHRWLDGCGRWRSTRQLTVGSELRRLAMEREEARAATEDRLRAGVPAGLGIAGEPMRTLPEPIRAIEPGPRRSLVDIETSTGTFFAASLATHNCFARPTHEYLGLSAGLDFETKIFVKERAPELLRRALASPRWTPQVVAMSGVTDPYQPIERALRLARGCLEVLLEFRNPVAIITKSRLVARDADLLGALARLDCAAVSVSVTTLDPAVHRSMEPRTPRPALRLAAIEALAKAGVPVGVLVAPVVPGLTEHELPRILAAAADAGATHAGYVVLRLPHGVAELVEQWLARDFPDRKEKVLSRVRELRGGALYDSRWGVRQRGTGAFAAQIQQLFETGCRRAGLREDARRPLTTAHFRRPETASGQRLLF